MLEGPFRDPVSKQDTGTALRGSHYDCPQEERASETAVPWRWPNQAQERTGKGGPAALTADPALPPD